jgi:hypothetical protein
MFAALCVLFCAAWAHAQSPADLAARARPAQDPAAQLQTLLNVQDAEYRRRFFSETPIADRLLFDYGGSFRFGYSLVQDSQSQNQHLMQYDGRFYGRLELDGFLRLYGRLRVEYDDWNTIGNFAPSGEGWQDPIGELYYAEFDFSQWMASQDGAARDWDLRIRGGRQYIVWGSGLTLSNYMYAGVLDAGIDIWRFQGIIGISAGSDTVDWDTSRPGYDGNTERLFLGGRLELNLGSWSPYFFYLAQFDQNAGQMANLPGGVPAEFQAATKFDYQSQYWGIGINGSIGSNLVCRAEFVLETGSTWSDSIFHDPNLPPTMLARPQSRTAVLAQAGIFGLTWLARDAMDTRVDFQFVAGSGSANRLDSGNTYGGINPGITDTSFNSLGYVNTGLVFAPDPANLCNPSITFSCSPFKGCETFGDLRVSATGFLYVRWDDNAPINVPTNLGGSNMIGSEVDFNVDWRLWSDVNFSIRYGVFIPNTSVFNDVENEPRQFLYTGVTYAF